MKIMNNAKEFLQECKKNKAFRLSTDTVSDQTLIDFAGGYKSYCAKAENLPISDVSFSEAEECEHDYKHAHTNWYECRKCGHVEARF